MWPLCHYCPIVLWQFDTHGTLVWRDCRTPVATDFTFVMLHPRRPPPVPALPQQGQMRRLALLSGSITLPSTEPQPGAPRSCAPNYTCKQLCVSGHHDTSFTHKTHVAWCTRCSQAAALHRSCCTQPVAPTPFQQQQQQRAGPPMPTMLPSAKLLRSCSMCCEAASDTCQPHHTERAAVTALADQRLMCAWGHPASSTLSHTMTPYGTCFCTQYSPPQRSNTPKTHARGTFENQQQPRWYSCC